MDQRDADMAARQSADETPSNDADASTGSPKASWTPARGTRSPPPPFSLSPAKLIQSSIQHVGTQTELAPTRLHVGFPFICFLTENTRKELTFQLPQCFHFGITGMFVRSPKIPISVNGITIPTVNDTGAEGSMLIDEAMLQLFPEGYFAQNNRQVQSLGGSIVTIQGPIRLSVEICCLQMMHDFYHLEGMKQSLLGYVWSNLVIRYKAHPFFFDQPLQLKSETADVLTQTEPLLPTDNNELMERPLITTVPWDSNAVPLPTDPNELWKMIESIAIVADASAHAYGKHDGTDIAALLNIDPQNHCDFSIEDNFPQVADTLQPLDCSSEALLRK